MFELIVILFLFLSLIMYALMGGADFGGGLWDFFATGPRAGAQRRAIARALGPIWEADHVWLILVVVLLFTGFPRAFAAIMTALSIPLLLMLVGIVLRGTAFIFRKYDSQAEAVHRHWSRLFGAASVVTPFFQGVIVGALVSGQIHFAHGEVTSGFMAGWLTPFALACGVFALGLFAFLAATYMTVETKDQPEVQNDFRLRALVSGVALAPSPSRFISPRGTARRRCIAGWTSGGRRCCWRERAFAPSRRWPPCGGGVLPLRAWPWWARSRSFWSAGAWRNTPIW